MKLQFRLQRLLHLREAVEKQQANVLGAAAHEESTRRSQSAETAQQLDQVQEQLNKNGEEPRPAGLYHAYGLTVEAAAAKAAEADAALKDAQAQREAEEARYHEARMARRVVEKLREKQVDQFKSEVNRVEQKELDEMARQRSSRSRESE